MPLLWLLVILSAWQMPCCALSYCAAKRLTQCSACLLTAAPPLALQAIQRLGLLGGRVPQFFNVSEIRRPLEPPPNAPAFVQQPAQPVTPLQQASAPAQQPRSREPPERFMCPISQDVRALLHMQCTVGPHRGLQPMLVC